MLHLIKKVIVLSVFTLSMNSCFVIINHSSDDNPLRENQSVKTSTQVCSPTLGGKLFTSAWIQRSAEYKALCFQAYNIAKLRLDEELSNKDNTRPIAIITDIDETILNNTPNAVHQALKGEDYTDKSWNEWCDMAKADTIAGALSFFNYAHSNGVEIFYISNRNEKNRVGTVKNLRKFGFPNVDNDHILLRSKSGDKTNRRSTIEKFYSIVLYIGDNLGDFLHKYDTSDEKARNNAVVSDRAEFGKKFIVLPNPNYGSWEKAMNSGYPELKEKDKKLTNELLDTY